MEIKLNDAVYYQGFKCTVVGLRENTIEIYIFPGNYKWVKRSEASLEPLRKPFKDKDFVIYDSFNYTYIVGYNKFKKSEDEVDKPTWYNKDKSYTHPSNEQILAYLTKEFWKMFKVGDKIRSVRSCKTIVLQGNEIFQIWCNSLAINLGNDDMIAIFDIDNIKWATKVEGKEKDTNVNWINPGLDFTSYHIKEKPLTNEENQTLYDLTKTLYDKACSLQKDMNDLKKAVNKKK